jgi:hypothetical protein
MEEGDDASKDRLVVSSSYKERVIFMQFVTLTILLRSF